MALVLNDRVKETSTTTGTGTLNLDGAVQDFESFVAGIGTTNETYYCIVNPGTGEFEVGRGTVTDATPDTLSRTQVFSSSNSDNPVNFTSGTKDVFCTLPASKAVVEDANNDVTLPADLTVGANIDVSSGTIKLDGNYPVGTNNVALGNGALEDNVSGGANTSIGNQAGRDVTSSNNTAIGGRALYKASSGDENTCVGSSTLFHTTGSNNTSIGFTAGSNLTSGNNCTFIGNQAQPSSATVSNEITLGNSSVTSLRIPGLQSGASSGDVLTYDGTDITLSTPTTGASEAFAIKMAVGL
tara:strand:- start:12 stop:905 length:894 start_codon:yes stop_codon:yes gene_type:complete